MLKRLRGIVEDEKEYKNSLAEGVTWGRPRDTVDTKQRIKRHHQQ